MPRPGVLQGAEAGLAFALLYGIGTGAAAPWQWLQLPVADDRYHKTFRWTSSFLCLAFVGYGLCAGNRLAECYPSGDGHAGCRPQPTDYRRSRECRGRPISHWSRQALQGFGDAHFGGLAKLEPRRVALLLGFGIAAALFWGVGNGLLLRIALHGLDSSYRGMDGLLPAEISAPEDPLKSGSSESLVSWASLGAQGRQRVLAVPSKNDISALTGGPALEPLRVYVGLNSAETAEERAALALAELKRVGAFDRSVLVIATPTGTGWVDPAGMAPLEFLHRGDVASVSVQYSYLPSWLSLLIEPDYGSDTARAVFQVVYGYWHALPKEHRPQLYLFGLSLGARNSDLSADRRRRGPLSRRALGGSALGQRDLAQGDGEAYSRKPGVAAALSRRVALPLYYAAQ